MKHRTSPIVRAVALVCGLFLLAIADGGDAHAQRDQVTDHRTPTARPGYVWTGTHWERVKAPTAGPVVPPPAVGPKPKPRPPVATSASTFCRDKRIECRASCATSPKNVIPYWIAVCWSNCNKTTKLCNYLE